MVLELYYHPIVCLSRLQCPNSERPHHVRQQLPLRHWRKSHFLAVVSMSHTALTAIHYRCLLCRISCTVSAPSSTCLHPCEMTVGSGLCQQEVPSLTAWMSSNPSISPRWTIAPLSSTLLATAWAAGCPVALVRRSIQMLARVNPLLS
jgi:hypothetical protein